MKNAPQWVRIHAILMVPGAGLEPARLAAGDFESPTSTNSITRATLIYCYIFLNSASAKICRGANSRMTVPTFASACINRKIHRHCAKHICEAGGIIAELRH
jgi:hypothetical protein